MREASRSSSPSNQAPAAERRRWEAGDLDPFPGLRVREDDALRVQQESGVAREGRANAGRLPAADRREPSFAVERLADQWVARCGEVNADLVRPSRPGRDLEQGGAGAPLQDANLAVRRPAEG